MPLLLSFGFDVTKSGKSGGGESRNGGTEAAEEMKVRTAPLIKPTLGFTSEVRCERSEFAHFLTL